MPTSSFWLCVEKSSCLALSRSDFPVMELSNRATSWSGPNEIDARGGRTDEIPTDTEGPEDWGIASGGSSTFACGVSVVGVRVDVHNGAGFSADEVPFSGSSGSRSGFCVPELSPRKITEARVSLELLSGSVSPSVSTGS